MEQTTRKRSERAPAEQVEETPEADVSREDRLAELDEILDEIDEVLKESDEEADRTRVAKLRAHRTLNDDSADTELARIGLFGPSDLDEAIAADVVEYAEQLAAQDTAALQAELAEFVSEQNPPCVWCGACPVREGCPFQADGDTFFRAFDDTFYSMRP